MLSPLIGSDFVNIRIWLVYCNLILVVLNILSRTMVYAASIRNNVDSFCLKFSCSVIVSKLYWYTFNLINFLKQNLSMSNFCVARLLTASLSLIFVTLNKGRNILLNRNCSFMIPLHGILHGRTPLENVIGRILRIQY